LTDQNYIVTCTLVRNLFPEEGAPLVSPTIRIDDDVFDELKKHAEPFVDTPNTVLRRLLNLGHSGSAETHGVAEVGPADEQDEPKRVGSARELGTRQRRKRTKAPRAPRAKTGSILNESAYELPILGIISEHGGRAAAREVLDELETRLNGQLTDVDKQELVSGDVRWRNRAQFVRLRLVEKGDMVKDSPRGIWEISDQGQRRIAAEAA
jgi:hypothetical protein